jgi:hypothetical protein
MRLNKQIHSGVWRCLYCGTESIQIGDELGCNNTSCPKGCPGNFKLVKRYPLATGIKGIKDAFERKITKFYNEIGDC